MQLKPPCTYDEQLVRLQKHGMIIENEEEALDFLVHVGYYRLTGYALQFRISEHNSDFVSGTSFAQVRAICEFDEEIRNLFWPFIESIEVYYRTIISYYFSVEHCILPPYDQHYDYSYYNDEKKIEAFFNSFKKQQKYEKNNLIFKHHLAKYNDRYPLWAITEMVSFSELSKLYACMKKEDEDRIASVVQSGGKMLRNNLHCLSVLRNHCAHAARLYNVRFAPPIMFSTSFLQNNPEIKNDTLFAFIILLAKRIPTFPQKKAFLESVIALLNKYKQSVDYTYIGAPKEYEECLNRWS